MRFDNVRLLAVQFPQVFAFYRDVIGLMVTWGDPESNYASFAGSDGVTGLGLFARSLMAETVGTLELPVHAVSQDKAAVVFAVEDVDAFAAAAKRAGAIFVTEPKDMPDWGIRAAHLRDPDGNLVEVFTPLKTSEWSAQLQDEAESQNRGGQ